MRGAMRLLDGVVLRREIRARCRFVMQSDTNGFGVVPRISDSVTDFARRLCLGPDYVDLIALIVAYRRLLTQMQIQRTNVGNVFCHVPGRVTSSRRILFLAVIAEKYVDKSSYRTHRNGDHDSRIGYVFAFLVSRRTDNVLRLCRLLNRQLLCSIASAFLA